jgi:hypothetical protein
LNLKEELLRALDDDPDLLLRMWLALMHVSVRCHYLRAARDGQGASRERLEGVFELCFVIAEQLRSLRAGRLAYPFDVFLAVLYEKAKDGRVVDDLREDALYALKCTGYNLAGCSGGESVERQE